MTLVLLKKNNSSNNNHKLKVSDLLFNDYSKNEKITSQLNLLKEKQIFAKNNRAVYNSTYDFTVQTETVRHIENTETGYESFTFAVHRENSNKIENLLISYKSDIDYYAYLVEYDFTKAEYQNLPTDIIRSRDVLMTPLDIAPSDYINDKITISIYGDIICVEEWEEIGIVSPRDLETITHYEWVITSEDCTWLNSGGGSSSGSNGDGSTGSDGNTSTGTGSSGGVGSSSDPSDSDYDPTTDPSNPANHGGIATSPVIADDNQSDPNSDDCNPLVTEVLDAIESTAESAWTLSTDSLGNPTFEYAFIVYRLNGTIYITTPFTSLNPEAIEKNDFIQNLNTVPPGAEIIATYHTHPNPRGLPPSHIDLASFLIDSVIKDNDFNAIMSIIHHDNIKYVVNIENETLAEAWLNNQNMDNKRRIRKRAKNFYNNNVPLNSTDTEHNETVKDMNINILGDGNNSGLKLYKINELNESSCQQIN